MRSAIEPWIITTIILTILSTCIQATWFPPMELTKDQWTTALRGYDLTTSYTTCTTEYTSTAGSARFITIYKDHPASLVLTGTGPGTLDVKFKDSTYIFDHAYELTTDSYLVIPPYQPVEWIWLRPQGSVSVCSYEGTVTEARSGSLKASGCECAEAIAAANTFTSVPFPRTIRKPEQQFFLTAEETPAANDVTICTILTVDRLLRLSQMSEFWGGPISAAVYLHDLAEIQHVMEWWLANNTMRRHVDIHLVQDDKIIAFALPDRAFPVNILRNVALRFARTANVFYIEGDFIPSPDLYTSLAEPKKILATGEKTVFIVAPFSSDDANFDMSKFPKNKQELKKLTEGHNAPLRDLSYFNSHSAFSFVEWFKSEEIYGMPFAGGYEPYYIGPKSYPLFEEIFIGCGADKVSHPAELSTAGYNFKVIPTGFIVHIDSTGMGSAWCRGWNGNERTSMKWDAFTTKTNNIYGGAAKGSFDSRIPWWDLAPVGQKAVTSSTTVPKDDEVCEERPKCPTCPDPVVCPVCQECPVCAQNAVCPPPSPRECSRFTEGYEKELAHVKAELAKYNTNTDDGKSLEATIKALKAENERLTEYSKFVVNVSLGVVVVLVVVVGMGVCVWPRGKKVWVLPTWKPTHHNL